MNRSEFIAAVAVDCGQTDAIAKAVLLGSGRVLSRALTSGDDAVIPGVGKFKTAQRAARMARNIKTGAEIQVPPHKAVKYKPNSDLKNAVSKA